MRERTLEVAQGADVVVMAAAVADFRPARTAPNKIKKDAAAEPDPIALVRNPDVLRELVTRRSGSWPVLVGFAAETGDDAADVLTYGRQKLARKGCDLLVVNAVGAGRAFGQHVNAAIILDGDGGEVDVPLGPKVDLAVGGWKLVADRFDRIPASPDRPPPPSGAPL